MNLRPLYLTGGAIIAIMLVVSAWAWAQIPAGADVPVHWGPDGQPDGYGPKWLGLLGLPMTAIAILALCAVLPRIEPRRVNLERSGTAYIATGIAAVALIGMLHVSAVLSILGLDIDTTAIALVGAGAMFIVIGNFLGKTRSHWFFGVRTPWTLSSDRSWAATHRLIGGLFIGLGALTIVLAIIFGGEPTVWIMVGGLFGVIAIAFAYSYLVWRDDPGRTESEAPQ